jgi:lipocalin
MPRLSSVLIPVFLAVVYAEKACPPAGFESIKSFDLKSFMSKRWYIQQQMEVSYLPKSKNRCVYAEYSPRSGGLPGFRYELSVHNHAEKVAAPHEESDASLCAQIVDAERGQLKVAPCFLPSSLAGPYWIIDYNEQEGFALISGGPPNSSAPGGCRTGTGVNGSGLWIFSRQQQRDQALVERVRGIAAAKGFDVSVLNDVDQTCNSESRSVSIQV